jgi:sulfide:quinone oxidoreductase
MAKHVVIVGGGVAGTIIANLLARGLKEELSKAEVVITMISKEDKHVYQPGFLYVLFDKMRPDELIRDQRSLLAPSIIFHHDTVVGIDPKACEVHTEKGKKIKYDYLVIATGSRPMPELIPGLKEHGNMFYTLESAVELREKLRKFEKGRIAIAMGVPHKCPVAPFEVTFMLDDYFNKKGIRDKVEIYYTYPIGRIHALEPVAQWGVPEFERRGIKYETLFNMEKVEAHNGSVAVHSAEGSTAECDLLITIPSHRGAQAIMDSGISNDGWVPTNRHSLKYEGYENVYVAGDTTNLPISKAGSTAHFESDVVADNLIAEIKEGHPAKDYDGKVMCFIETGFDKGTYIHFNYTTPPSPMPPSKMIHWLKLGYNRMYWLTARGVL